MTDLRTAPTPAPATARKARRERRTVGDAIWATILVLLCLLALLPFVFMLATSLQETSRMTILLDPAEFTLHNSVRLFAENQFARAITTSAVVVVLACTANMLVASLAAFAFEKKRFPGSEALFWLYLATMMVPGQVTLIPLYGIMRDLGLLNTYVALDGSSDLGLYVRIILPLIKPILVALTVFTLLTTWNDFLWPLVSITDDRMQTATLAAANLQGRFATDYGLVMAGATVPFLIPLALYVILPRHFVEGIVSSGVKG